MGGFILFPRDVDEPVDAVEKKYEPALDVFRKKNLTLGRRIVRDGFVAYRYRKVFGDGDSVIEFENGDFVLCTGTFIYGDSAGRDALAPFYNDFSATGLAEERIAGNFHLLIYKNGELWSLSDYCGYYPTYEHAGSGTVSSSFLAVGKLEKKPEISEQAFYEYVFHGFCVNEETPLAGVRKADSRCLRQIHPVRSSTRREPAYEPISAAASPAQVVDAVSSRLNAYFGNLVNLFHGNIGSALSGGYDSRHMLALLHHAGAEPYLYVYGSKDSPDVRCAEAIARGEKLTLNHIDKSESPRVGVAAFRQTIERNVYFFDALKPLGLIDDGSDLETRYERARHSGLLLNGAGGEIYREIWNIGDRQVDILDFLRMRFDSCNYGYCHGRFRHDEYFARFAEKVRGILGIESDLLERRHAEVLFPFLRNRFAQNNNLANNQLGHALLPFMEPRFVFPSFDIPIGYKYCGALHSALIRAAAPSLARYESAYGINFSDRIPLGYRLKRALERQYPLSLRLLKRKRESSKPQPMPYFFGREYLDSILDMDSLAISDYVNVNKINNPEILSRAFSIELLIMNLSAQ